MQRKMRKKVVNYAKIDLNDEIYQEKLENDPNFKMIYLDIFNKQLHKLNIYDDIIRIISNDNDYLYQYYNDWKYAKQMAEQRITQSFKKFFNECSQWGKKKMKSIILEHLHFKEFFEIDETLMKEQL